MKTQVFVQIVPTFLYQKLTFEGKLTWMKKSDFNLQRNIYMRVLSKPLIHESYIMDKGHIVFQIKKMLGIN
jgi:hypothetical protein